MIIDRRRLAVNPPSRIQASMLRIAEGSEMHSVLVLDGWYRNPHYVRELALSLDYTMPRFAFPGYEASLSIDPAFLLKGLQPFAEAELELAPNFDRRLVFSMIFNTVSPRLRRQQDPHSDGIGGLAVVVYLNLPSQCRGGTAFYRHRRSGLVAMPGPRTAKAKALGQMLGTASYERTRKRLLQGPRTGKRLSIICGSTAKWQLALRVPMRFNRLVLYPCHLFHSPVIHAKDFPETARGRRLTQTFFVGPK